MDKLLRRRQVLSGLSQLASLAALSPWLSGCGSSGDNPASLSAGGAPGGGGGDLLTPSLTVGKQNGPGLDPGVLAKIQIEASKGGTVSLPDGAFLVIPPGAAPADFELSITIPTGQVVGAGAMRYLLEPQGMTFKSPVVLHIPLGSLKPEQFLIGAISSTVNPVVDLGSELTNWTQPKVVTPGVAGFISFELLHFTFVALLVAGPASAYLVLDIPTKYLQAGDMAFFLTTSSNPALGNARSWQPGHVAGFLGGGTDELVEANGEAVVKNTLAKVRSHDGHIYLGARRNVLAGPLSDEQKKTVREFLLSRVGAAYSLIGDTLINDIIRLADAVFDFNNGGKLSYSCASLVEAALRKVGQGVSGIYQHAYFLTPIEMYSQSLPVPEIEIEAGAKFSLPIYGATLSPESSYFNNLLNGGYVRDNSYTVVPNVDLPTDSTFSATTYEGFPAYLFEWTPARDQIDKTVQISFKIRADHLPSVVNPLLFISESFSESLSLKIIAPPSAYDIRLLSAGQESHLLGASLQVDVNRAGVVAHLVWDQGGVQQVRLDDGTAKEIVVASAPDNNTFFSDIYLNDDGHVCYSRRSSLGPTEAFLWSGQNEPLQNLGNLGGLTPSGVAGNGQVFPRVPQTTPMGLNNNDVVVGISLPVDAGVDPIKTSMFRWELGFMKEIPGGHGLLAVGPGMGINDLGQVVAHFRDLQFKEHTVLFDAGTTVLQEGSLDPNEYPRVAINNHQQVLYNTIEVRGSSSGFRPQLWKSDTGAQLLKQMPEWGQSIGRDLNDNGKAVGTAVIFSQDFARLGVLWQDGQAIDLNSTVPPGSPKITDALAIGNGDHIVVLVQVGNGQQRLALLTPKA